MANDTTVFTNKPIPVNPARAVKKVAIQLPPFIKRMKTKTAAKSGGKLLVLYLNEFHITYGAGVGVPPPVMLSPTVCAIDRSPLAA